MSGSPERVGKAVQLMAEGQADKVTVTTNLARQQMLDRSNERSRLFVLSELPKIVYYWLWHGLLGIAEDPQWAVDLERVYMGLVREFFGERAA